MSAPSIVWFRRDLRLADQPALAAAAARGAVVPLYVLDDETPGARRMGGASRWWLHRSLAELDRRLRRQGSRLILRRGRTDAVLTALALETGAGEVHALHHYEPWWREAERLVGERLSLTLHHGNYLAPPGAVLSGAGTPYKIFTPFWRRLCERLPPPPPLPEPNLIRAPTRWPPSERLEDWRLVPDQPDWATGFAEWNPGEAGAAARLNEFRIRAADYDRARDLPALDGTSRLSPHLHFGELSPAMVWQGTADPGGSVDAFRRELGWRDYAQNVLLQFPDYAEQSYQRAFDRLPWRSESQALDDLRAWQRGRTGYPIVDAGMRQLWATGWMHNRVRMIAASFLIKHLLIDWREGERWFRDTLVDADHANNAVNWQWSAGSGIDANLFVRIMAPLAQSAKFRAGDYIRRWVPELASLPDAAIHDPPDELRGCYPAKIVEHRFARERALAAHAAMKRT